MIKAKATDAEGKPLIILGLSSQNMERLKEGKPVFFSNNSLGIEGNTLITYGDTDKDIIEDIKECFGEWEVSDEQN